jgi:hypothetical protein
VVWALALSWYPVQHLNDERLLVSVVSVLVVVAVIVGLVRGFRRDRLLGSGAGMMGRYDADIVDIGRQVFIVAVWGVVNGWVAGAPAAVVVGVLLGIGGLYLSTAPWWLRREVRKARRELGA